MALEVEQLGASGARSMSTVASTSSVGRCVSSTLTCWRLKAAVGRAGWLALGVAAGAGLPVQGAVNAQLRTAIDAPLTVAAISFTVATIAIAVVLAVLLAARATPMPALRPLGRMPWWGWLGGLCAVAYVTATTVALAVTGQQLASAVIDQVACSGCPSGHCRRDGWPDCCCLWLARRWCSSGERHSSPCGRYLVAPPGR